MRANGSLVANFAAHVALVPVKLVLAVGALVFRTTAAPARSWLTTCRLLLTTFILSCTSARFEVLRWFRRVVLSRRVTRRFILRRRVAHHGHRCLSFFTEFRFPSDPLEIGRELQSVSKRDPISLQDSFSIGLALET